MPFTCRYRCHYNAATMLLRLPQRAATAFLVSMVFALPLACRSTVTTFPNQLRDASGNAILLDDVEAIVNDAELTEDEKREQLRELGIEDEELIDALLTL